MGCGGRPGGLTGPGGRCNGLPQAVEGAVATEGGGLGEGITAPQQAVGSCGSNVKSSYGQQIRPNLNRSWMVLWHLVFSREAVLCCD